MRGEPADVGSVAAVELRERVAVAERDALDKKIVRPWVGAHILYSAGLDGKFPQGWNFFASIFGLILKRSNVVSSTVSAPAARLSRNGHFMPSTSR